MKTARRRSPSARRPAIAVAVAIVALLAGTSSLHANTNTNSGVISVSSAWPNTNAFFVPPPGNGSGTGDVVVAVWQSGIGIFGNPTFSTNIFSTNSLPAAGVYAYSLVIEDGGDFDMAAWIDGNADGLYNNGEPRSPVIAISIATNDTSLPTRNFTVVDDADGDGMPDWWEVFWMSNLNQAGAGDVDRDGLSNLQEYTLSIGATELTRLSPTNWDSDADGMDDRWETDHYANGFGLLAATNSDAGGDPDGDALTNYAEYVGADGIGPLEQDPGAAAGVARSTGSADELDPLDFDTDGDTLVDGFEFIFIDLGLGISPAVPTGAGLDPDNDGLTTYREQALHDDLREGGSRDIWSTNASLSFPAVDANGIRAFAPAITIAGSKWTDPADPDTDGDLLPDGWEIEFNLDPLDGFFFSPDGTFGDPDGDGLANLEEYQGPDTARSGFLPLINGTGDETNPNEHNWRPGSTVAGLNIERPAFEPPPLFTVGTPPTDGTLGGALPTSSPGVDNGADTDDDGIDDRNEAQVAPLTSPMHSMSPFVGRAVCLTATNGIPVPDPEGNTTNGFRADLHATDWTLESYVKIGDTNVTGHIIDMPGPVGLAGFFPYSYRLELSNGIPRASFYTLGQQVISIAGESPLPTNQWTHIAASWNGPAGSLSLVVDALFIYENNVNAVGISSLPYPMDQSASIGASADGSFTSAPVCIDEVRLWGVARSIDDIDAFHDRLLPPETPGLLAYFRFDDGGTSAEDFTRRAQNSLLNATDTDYVFADHGYALATNLVFTNDAADVRGVDANGADDQDGDGLPDAWEALHGLDPGSAIGINGAAGDPDGDTLTNLNEYRADTNPQATDTDVDGTPDVNEDRDGDGLRNIDEQIVGSRLDIVDTDDDGLTDQQEWSTGASPIDATDADTLGSLCFNGADTDFLDAPLARDQALSAFTLEAWIMPTNVVTSGRIIERSLETLGGGARAANYMLGVTNVGGNLAPMAGFIGRDGTETLVTVTNALPLTNWTHLAVTFDTNNLTLYVNVAAVATTNTSPAVPPTEGVPGETSLRVGQGFAGFVDEARIWTAPRGAAAILADLYTVVPGSRPNLLSYFRFDDNQANEDAIAFGAYHQPHGAEDFTETQDWEDAWAHAAALQGSVYFATNTPMLDPPLLQVVIEPQAARDAGAQWIFDGDGGHDSGTTISNTASPGAHEVTFSPLTGWVAPATTTVDLVIGQATTITGTYVEALATLQVFIEPAGAVADGAMWQADDGAFTTNGGISNLTFGAHTVDFLDLAAWITPDSANVSVTNVGPIVITNVYGQRTVTGTVDNASSWDNLPPFTPPGSGTGTGDLVVGVWDSASNIVDAPLLTTTLASTNALPFDGGIATNYQFTGLATGSYFVAAWIDGDGNGLYDIGEPRGSEQALDLDDTPETVVDLAVGDDLDADTMPDWWEAHWFSNTTETAAGDFDRDGLSNGDEYTASTNTAGWLLLNPAHWDSDGDLVDDSWEIDNHANGAGLDPLTADASGDADGDGLHNIHEYNGVDGLPLLEQDPGEAVGIARSAGSADDLDPLDIDTDGDTMIDSFEAAWVNGGLNPAISGSATGDADGDGMTAYREQALLPPLGEGGSNDIWTAGSADLPVADTNGLRAFAAPLILFTNNATTISNALPAAQAQGWTDPNNADTDNDQLPDGWEVEFELDPVSAAGTDGMLGDADGDGLVNLSEYRGADGRRASAAPFLDGTGDETNPNEHNLRPASTVSGAGLQRPAFVPHPVFGLPTLSTQGTLGGAKPTASLGLDDGADTDDDGIADDVEIQVSVPPTSPVHSMSPAVRRGGLITSSNGIVIPDPEGNTNVGFRADLLAAEWTLEAHVNIATTNVSGNLIDIPGPLGLTNYPYSYRLALSNGIPRASFYTAGGLEISVAGATLPTGRWLQVSASWNDAANSLDLYVDGTFNYGKSVFVSGISADPYPLAQPATIGVAADGSFSNALGIDEVRIWGVARSAQQVSDFRDAVVQPTTAGLLAYFRFDDGGTSAEDFTRRAKTGLLGAASPDYTFADHGWGLPTNGFAFSANAAGVDGIDDADDDGLPDAWELLHGLDPQSGTGADGADGDPDGDGLNNLNEYRAGTNPRAGDSDGDSTPDDEEDLDGDGLDNGFEQTLATRVDMADTDDDGLTDQQEWSAGSDPLDADDPDTPSSLLFDGGTTDYLAIPAALEQALSTFTIEAWIMPSNTATGGTIIERTLEDLGGGLRAANYSIGLETNAGGLLVPVAGFVTRGGDDQRLVGPPIPFTNWSHLAVSFATNHLTLFVNAAAVATTNTSPATAPTLGVPGQAFVRLGAGYAGIIDEARIWNFERPAAIILAELYIPVAGTDFNLVNYFRFDDEQANEDALSFGAYHQARGAQEYAETDDWEADWAHAATLNGGVRFVTNTPMLDPPRLQVVLEPQAARDAGAQWIFDGDGGHAGGTTISNIASPGDHTITFADAPGWTPPGTTAVNLVVGQLTTVTATYVEAFATLQVFIEPAGAVADGAMWQADDGAFTTNAGISNLTFGSHTVGFLDLPNWISPADANVNATNAGPIVITNVYDVRTLTGVVVNASTWDNLPPLNPPGSGTGTGDLVVGVWDAGSNIVDAPLLATTLASTNALPFADGVASNYLFTGLATGTYFVAAWIDGNTNGLYDIGEPRGADRSFSPGDNPVTLINLELDDDLDDDGLPDWWEGHWFSNTTETAAGDFDRDGLSNGDEYTASTNTPGWALLNPAHWDSDGDLVDDSWEIDNYANGAGLDPLTADAFGDADGDGLHNIHEYNGVDGLPRLEQDPGEAAGIARNAGSTDNLDPLDIDTDGDTMIDSFEAAWVDGGLDPAVADVATGDADGDGMTAYREQALLPPLGEGGSNDIWTAGSADLPVADTNGLRAFAAPLVLFTNNATTIANALPALQAQGWTDPNNVDTDADLLPDGWEVEFNLNPASDSGDDGFLGDPDGDGLVNLSEFRGADGLRATTAPSLDGTGDETNPNGHDLRPASTVAGAGLQRPPFVAHPVFGLPTISDQGTLGGASPTASLGLDDGADTDDDGIADNVEILASSPPTSPVHSMSPVARRSGLITSTNGIVVPDPEGNTNVGFRADLRAADWTLEAHVNIATTNVTGSLLEIPGPLGLVNLPYSYRLELSNGVPRASFYTPGGALVAVVGTVLPTGRWVQVSATWNDADNAFNLYLDGVFNFGQGVFVSGVSADPYPLARPVTIGAAADGSFSNVLGIDEVRIWGVARSATEIDDFHDQVVQPDAADLLAYFRFDDGGTTAEDLTRRAKSGLLGAASPDYTFADHGWGLPTNGFTFSTNAAAVDGIDDSDGDGLPDDWELLHGLDAQSAAGDDGAAGDPDGDSLDNLNEYRAGTNPRGSDSDGDGTPDGDEDFDGDGIDNLTEQGLGSRVDIADTDDDGLTDEEEWSAGTDLLDATAPDTLSSLLFGGSANDYAEVPSAPGHALTSFTIEAWIMPSNTASGGVIIERSLEDLGGGLRAANYRIGIETNASGELLPVGGFIGRDATESLIVGQPIPTSDWTHVALTFSANNLALYVNASEVGTTNTAPVPTIGAVGQTFLRFGQGFAGHIDEVRIWDTERSQASILADLYTALGQGTANLLHSFLFDDDQANTNALPFAATHQAQGAQDFMQSDDWEADWAHAASLHGDVRFVADTPVTDPPRLQVIIEPQEARDGGALWSYDGDAGHSSGTILSNVTAPGEHLVTFSSVFGLATPASNFVNLSIGRLTTITGVYTEIRTSIQVFIEPPEVVGLGAMWQLDGGPFTNSGAIVTNLTVGDYTISYLPVVAWAEPTNHVISITNEFPIVLTNAYSTNVTGISVLIVPDEIATNGGAWSVDGGVFTNSGVFIPTTTGTHEVAFSNVPGWLRPTNRTVEVVTNQISTIVAGYTELLFLGSAGALVGEFDRPRGLAFDSARRLHVADSDNHRIQALDPNTGQWSAFGVFGTDPGEFKQPFAVAFDGDDNLWVADENNNRVQRRDSDTGTWTVWGGPNTGTGPGEFNQPYDLAIDSATNVYVADRGNRRVQKLTPAGVWSTFVTNGFAAGFVRNPQGVAVDQNDLVYVVDELTNATGYVRIQTFDTNATFVALIGSTATDEGEFDRSRAMLVTTGQVAFVADTGNDRIMSALASGADWHAFADQEMNGPEGVAMDQKQDLFIADTGNNRIIHVKLAAAAGVLDTGIVSMSMDGDSLTVRWQGKKGWIYDLQAKENLFDPTWMPVPGSTNLMGVGGVLTGTDPNAVSQPRCFYRIIAR